MKTKTLMILSTLTLGLMLASAPSFAAAQTTTPTPQTPDLKAQLKADKAQLKSDIKSSGKDSEVVKADQAKVKQDKDAIVSKRAKKHMRSPKTPDTTTPSGTNAPVTPPSS